MEYLVQAGQLILSLSILIVLHEFGHFIPARIFKTRVEKFYLFFNPWFSLFKVKKGETEWGLGWLPLGGYVKISGMIDESMDKEQMSKPAEPWEFRSKPAWQRLIIMLGGVTVNFILGYLIYIMVLFVWGKQYLPTENATYGMYINNPALLGEDKLLHGDILVSVEGHQPKTLADAGTMIIIDGARKLEVIRNGSLKQVTLPGDISDQLLESGKKSLPFDPRVPFVAESVKKGMGADAAGIQKGDSIIGVDNEMNPFFQDIANYLGEHKASTVQLHIVRNDSSLTIPVEVNEDGFIGIQPVSPDKFLSYKTEKFTFLESIPEGISTGTETLVNYVKSLALVFSPAGAKQLGGFGSIGGMFPKSWDWQKFWLLTAFISIILAFMNLLPIPALDGGHVMFLIYEMIRGKAPSQKFLEIAQTIGMVLLLGLLVYANLNDILKLF